MEGKLSRRDSLWRRVEVKTLFTLLENFTPYQSQAKIAELIGTTQIKISRWSRGEGAPSTPVLEQLLSEIPAADIDNFIDELVTIRKLKYIGQMESQNGGCNTFGGNIPICAVCGQCPHRKKEE